MADEPTELRERAIKAAQAVSFGPDRPLHVEGECIVDAVLGEVAEYVTELLSEYVEGESEARIWGATRSVHTCVISQGPLHRLLSVLRPSEGSGE